MISEFEKEYLPIWCEGCDQQGFIFIDDPDNPYFVTCKTCGWETSQVWCSKCQMGGEYVMNISKRPPSWSCPSCKTKYALPERFYENPISLFIEEELPSIVQERIEKDFQLNRFSSQNFWFIIKTTVTLLLVTTALVAVGLLPLALVYTPLPWTIPGFIAMLVIFAVWWWLMGKATKFMRKISAKDSS